MSTISVKNMPMMNPPSNIEKLRGQKADNLEGEKVRLKKATKEFESFVFYEMMKTMRKTIPESSFAEGTPFSGGMGKDIFTQMFDMELSQKLSTGGKNSVSEMLFHQMEKIIEAEFKMVDAGKNVESLKNISNKSIELSKKNFIERPAKLNTITQSKESDKFQPIKPSGKSKSMDKIISEFGPIIDLAAKANAVDSALIASVIKVESAGNSQAVSTAGAKGLMQLIDSTASDYGVNEVFDPKQNIGGGTKYLSNLIKRFGDVKLALAAYNAGPGNVEKYGGIPPFSETREYVDKVMDTYKEYQNVK